MVGMILVGILMILATSRNFGGLMHWGTCNDSYCINMWTLRPVCYWCSMFMTWGGLALFMNLGLETWLLHHEPRDRHDWDIRKATGKPWRTCLLACKGRYTTPSSGAHRMRSCYCRYTTLVSGAWILVQTVKFTGSVWNSLGQNPGT